MKVSATYWFTCPDCGTLASIDADQAEGRVSIACMTAGCTFHQTGVVRPLIPTTTPTKPENAPQGFQEVT